MRIRWNPRRRLRYLAGAGVASVAAAVLAVGTMPILDAHASACSITSVSPSVFAFPPAQASQTITVNGTNMRTGASIEVDVYTLAGGTVGFWVNGQFTTSSTTQFTMTTGNFRQTVSAPSPAAAPGFGYPVYLETYSADTGTACIFGQTSTLSAGVQLLAPTPPTTVNVGNTPSVNVVNTPSVNCASGCAGGGGVSAGSCTSPVPSPTATPSPGVGTSYAPCAVAVSDPVDLGAVQDTVLVVGSLGLLLLAAMVFQSMRR